MRKMGYRQTLKYMFERLPMFQRVGAAAYKKDLSNIIALCAYLGDPHLHFPSIHIAGTNGKGSVTHMIAAGLMAQGFKVGIYTSPHYKDFRERIKINGAWIQKKEVIDFIHHLKEVIEKIQPSFFEITLALAFDYFRNEKVDYAVIETGLGGRLDSTNIITPMLSVITNISFDHQSFLGNSLPEIAGEKAGIIKPGITVLIGERQKEVEKVFLDKARVTNSLLFFAEDMITISPSWSVDFGGKSIVNRLELDIDGPFVVKNLRTSFAALMLLANLGIPIEWSRINTLFSDFSNQLQYIGRWHWIGKNPDILCDSAHNQAGIQQSMQRIRELKYKRVHLILGFSEDKDLNTLWPWLPPYGLYYFVKAKVPRGLPVMKLKDCAEKAGIQGKIYISAKKALAAAKKKASEEDLIYIGGSIFVIGEIL
ncbi:MAG TPA: Mur ligase family protein [Saprospiraceae bacterium]|nr:Mur ligase family protein [Saprospiraceae bacterium]